MLELQLQDCQNSLREAENQLELQINERRQIELQQIGQQQMEQRREVVEDNENNERRSDQSTCAVCLIGLPIYAHIPCGHMSYCFDCYPRAIAQGNILRCPNCRSDGPTLRIYL